MRIKTKKQLKSISLKATKHTKGIAGGYAYEPPVWARIHA